MQVAATLGPAVAVAATTRAGTEALPLLLLILAATPGVLALVSLELVEVVRPEAGLVECMYHTSGWMLCTTALAMA